MRSNESCLEQQQRLCNPRDIREGRRGAGGRRGYRRCEDLGSSVVDLSSMDGKKKRSAFPQAQTRVFSVSFDVMDPC